MNMPPATALGPLHVPVASGVPFKATNNEVAGLLMQRVRSASAPAFGGCTKVMVTVELTLVHGSGTAMEYVYTPALIVAGSNSPSTTALGPLHVPPASGVPLIKLMRSTAAPVVHNVAAPGVPGSGLVTTFTVTVAEVDGQGVVPATV